MAQSTPDAEIPTTGSSGRSVAHASAAWFGGALELAAGDNFQLTGDGSNLTTDKDTALVGADTSTSALTVTLASADVQQGRVIVVKDQGGNGATNAITVDTEGSETIDGSASTSISTNFGVVRLYSDGTNWFTI